MSTKAELIVFGMFSVSCVANPSMQAAKQIKPFAFQKQFDTGVVGTD